MIGLKIAEKMAEVEVRMRKSLAMMVMAEGK